MTEISTLPISLEKLERIAQRTKTLSHKSFEVFAPNRVIDETSTTGALQKAIATGYRKNLFSFGRKTMAAVIIGSMNSQEDGRSSTPAVKVTYVCELAVENRLARQSEQRTYSFNWTRRAHRIRKSAASFLQQTNADNSIE